MIPLGLNDSLLLTSLQKGIILLLMSNPVVAQSLLHICFISFKLSPFEFLSFQVGDSYSLKKSKLQQKKFEISRSQQLNHSKPQQKTTNNHSAPYKAYLAPTKRSLENKSYWNSSRKPIWKVDVQYIYIYNYKKIYNSHQMVSKKQGKITQNTETSDSDDMVAKFGNYVGVDITV